MSNGKTSSKWTSGSNAPVVWGVDMASGESRSVTMTVGDETFPVQDVVWTGFPPHKPEAGSAEIKVTAELPKYRDGRIYSFSTPGWGKVFMSNLWEKARVRKTANAILEGPKGQGEKDMGVGRQMDTWRKAMNDPAEFIKIYFDAMNEEENVNYLFEVFVIDLKEQGLVGSHYVVCSDVSRAVTVATLRHELKEDELSSLKFHVHKICEVPAWDGD